LVLLLFEYITCLTPEKSPVQQQFKLEPKNAYRVQIPSAYSCHQSLHADRNPEYLHYFSEVEDQPREK